MFNNKMNLFVKIILIVVMILVGVLQFSGKELDSYYSYKDYVVNENTENVQCMEYSINGLSQKFVAQGNIFNVI